MSPFNQSLNAPPLGNLPADNHHPGNNYQGPSNSLLAALPADEYAVLRPHLRSLNMELGRILNYPGQNMDCVYFVESGMISIVLTTNEGTEVEVGAVGREGVVGAVAALTQTPILGTIMVQIHGDALTLPGEVLRREFKRGGALQEAILRHLQSLAVLSAQAALCNRLHSVEKRLARWLLMVQDRVGDNHLELTHEFIAGMLGARRAGVTEAAGTLREAGLIEYDRGHIQIIDRPGLEAMACECYKVSREQFQHAIF